MGLKKNAPYISIFLVVCNLVIFLICTFTGDLLYNIGDFSPYDFADRGEYYRIISSMFLHADIRHLVNNMLLLAGLGMMLEKETGHVRFLLLYLLSGLGGQALSLLNKFLQDQWYTASIGASGAVFGLVGVLLAMSLCLAGRLHNVTWKRIVFMVVYSVYSGVQAADIDNAAHIGGFLSGLLLGLLLCVRIRLQDRKRNRNF